MNRTALSQRRRPAECRSNGGLWETKPLPRPENTDYTLSIDDPVRGHPSTGPFERNHMNLQELSIVMASSPAGQKPLSQKQSDRSCGESDRRIEGAQLEQPTRTKPDLFLALPPGGRCRALAVINNAGRNFIDGAPDGRSILPNEVDSTVVVDRHDRNGVRRANDVTDRLPPIRQDHRLLLG